MNLKYKVWDKAKKRMFYWGKDFGYITEHKVVLLNSGGMIMPPNVETLLYSGLPDENGNDICEGDLIKCQIGLGEWWAILRAVLHPKIIGNIYETPID